MKVHSRLYCLRKLRSMMFAKTFYRCLYSYYLQEFNFRNDLVGWECIQTGQKQTRQKHQEGRWDGGEKARKYRRTLSSVSDKQNILIYTFGGRVSNITMMWTDIKKTLIDWLTNKLRTIFADETHLLRSEFDNRHIEATDLWFPVTQLHNTYSHSFQWSFRHTINKQTDKHNMQWLETEIGGYEAGIK